MKKAGNPLRKSAFIAPNTKLPAHTEETEQELQSHNAPESYSIQQHTESHANDEPYDSTVMGSHPPLNAGSGSA